MRPSWKNLLLLGLLASLSGCQLTPVENLNSPVSGIGGTPGTPNQLELPPKKAAEVCVVTAEEMEKAGKDKEAIALYEKARQNGTPKPVGRHLAVLYDKQGDYKRALQEYQKLLKRTPKDADLLNDIGYCYYNQGKWTEAEKYLRQAVSFNPNLACAWINLGMTLAQDQRVEQSLEAFTKVVTPAQAQCNLAFIWMTQGKFEEAKAAYRRALSQEPNLILAQVALAKLEQPASARATAPVASATTSQVAVERESIEDQAPIVVP